MNIAATTTPYLNLSAVISALRGCLGGWHARGFLSQALMFLLYRRLAVIGGKMERLIQRFEAGRLFRRRPCVAASSMAPAATCERSARVQSIWPRRFAWLVRAAAYQAAGFGSQLRAVLETPEMVALLVAAPQAVEILRPLCRMLAIETSVLRPRPAGCVREIVPERSAGGEAGEVAEIGEAKRQRVRVAAKPVDWGRIPLPHGVLAAARRQGFGKTR